MCDQLYVTFDVWNRFFFWIKFNIQFKKEKKNNNNNNNNNNNKVDKIKMHIKFEIKTQNK